jgi:hypothetical protein
MMRVSPGRLAFLIALLCAVSLRLLTPPGWMPNLDGQGAPLVICTGDGAHVMRPAGPAHAPPGKASHEVCVFAGFALGAAPLVAAAVSSVAPPEPAALPLPAAQTRSAPSRRRPQAARAPPVLA